MAKVSPVLENVVDNGDGTYSAVFGYNSTYTTEHDIAIGSLNGFSPIPSDRGQPTTFEPGRKVAVFSVTWESGNLVWQLDGSTATASISSAKVSLSTSRIITVMGPSYYVCNPMTAVVWVRDPGVNPGDNLILMAVSDPYGNILDTDSSIKLELFREGNDFRLVYFSSQSQLVDRTTQINLRDGKWHFLSYECMDDGYMRYSIDGVELPASTGVDGDGRTLSQARSKDVRPGGGQLWTPYLYKAGQSIYMYQLRFGVDFNLGLPWIRELMEIDKRKLRIQ